MLQFLEDQAWHAGVRLGEGNVRHEHCAQRLLRIALLHMGCGGVLQALQQGGLHPVQHCQPDGFLALEVLEHPPLGDANGLCQRGRGDFGGAVLCGQLQRSLHQLRLAVGGSVLGAWELGHGFW